MSFPSPHLSLGSAMRSQYRRRRDGLTLIELVVVIVILGLLVGIVAPQVLGRVSEARGTTARTQIEMLSLALDNYRLDTGGYPLTEQGLMALRDKPIRPPMPAAWRGPYLRRALPDDPWGRPYVYRFPGQRNPNEFDLFSLGRDGKPGGTEEDADIGRP